MERPELLLSLNYLPQAERLTVVLMKAKNLETHQDPYVKVNFSVKKKHFVTKKMMIIVIVQTFSIDVFDCEWKANEKEEEQLREIG